MDDLFAKLDDQDFFRVMVMDHYRDAPGSAVEHFPCTNNIDPARIDLAFNQYQQSLATFKVLLDSKNPDHYKRSGAVLHALYKNQILTSLTYGDGAFGTMDELEADQPLGYSYDNIQGMLRYARFYEKYHNQMLAFNLAYSFCHAYEDDPIGFDYSYLENTCHYLWKNEDLSVDSLSMMFRSLMHRG